MSDLEPVSTVIREVRVNVYKRPDGYFFWQLGGGSSYASAGTFESAAKAIRDIEKRFR